MLRPANEKPAYKWDHESALLSNKEKSAIVQDSLRNSYWQATVGVNLHLLLQARLGVHPATFHDSTFQIMLSQKNRQ